MPDPGTTVPRDRTPPIRLTYNPGADYDASWLPDGSGILYTAAQLDRDDADHCVALLPPGGGRIRSLTCEEDPSARSSTDVLRAAVRRGDRLAFVHERWFADGSFNADGTLRVGSVASADHADSVRAFPFTPANGPTLYGASQLRWLNESQIVYRGDFAGLLCVNEGPGCPRILVRTGLGLLVQQVGAAPGPATFLAGTANASSVAVSGDGDEIFYTVDGDSRVFRRIVSTGTTTVFHDFGPGVIARDVQLAGERLLAVTGGSVQVAIRNGIGAVQFDFGGDIRVVDLATRQDSVISAFNVRYQHLALSADGTRLVAESGGDLFLFYIP